MTTVVQVTIDEQNPWPGLGSFDEGAERFFNGRHNESVELRRLVLNAPLTVLFGASGLGKTSLVQAGLFPVLRKEHFLPVYVRLDLRDRTAQLIDQVKFALRAQFGARRIDAPVMYDHEDLWSYLHRAGLELWSEQNQLLTPLFVFDQFEEVFTLGTENPAGIARLRIDLADLIENRLPAALADSVERNEAAGEALSLDSQRYKVLLSFREDFLPALEGWKRNLPSILRNRLRLLPMSGEQAFQAVHTTAAQLVDESLARKIVRFVAAAQEERAGAATETPDSMRELAVEPALLSLVCHGLNEKRKAQNKPAFDEALLSGAGQAIISDYYQGAVGDLPERVQRFIENELITERGFRKPCDIDDARSVHGVTDLELRRLVDRRVLRIEPQRGTERVELTHDLLTQVVREHRNQQRERIRQAEERIRVRRVQRMALFFGLATAILVAGLLVYFVAKVWDYDAYYKDYVKVWGVPRGIGPLTNAEVRHQTASYKITRRGRLGPIVSMQLVNAGGQPRDLMGTVLALGLQDEIIKKTSRWEYVYDAQRRVAYEISLDRKGQRLQSIIYAPSGAGSGGSRTAYKTALNGSLAREKGSCMAFERYDYSPEGYETGTHYLDQDGLPTPGKAGAFITQREYDKQRGYLLQSISLWEDSRRMNDEAGNAELRKSYDDSGDVIAEEALDAAGRPIDFKRLGYQRFTCKYDDRGNCAEATAWHADGSSYLTGGLCQSRKLSYDNRGNLVKEVCLRSDGQPIGSGEIKYDKDDRLIEEMYFDRAGRPAPEPDDGAFRLTLTRDAEGNVTETAFFDENGKPTLGFNGFHKAISKFDSGGHEIRTEFRDKDGKLVAIEGGYAAVEREYDPRGNEVRTSYFGIDNRPVANRNEGFAIKQTSFDACGRETESKFLDKNGHPVRSNKGYAQIKKTYDDSNNVVGETYLDQDEKERPIRSVEGYAHVARQFDRHRNIIDERYFDEKDHALLLNGTYAEHTSRYDDHNALVEETFLEARGELVPNEKGWAKHTRRYDEHNALVEEAYFGARGESVLIEKGWARMTNVNDAHGREIERTYFGTDGKPINAKGGYAKSTSRYDSHGAMLERAYFGATGEPVLIDEGFASVKNVNDELGRTIEQAYFGVRGEPVIGTKGYRYHRGKYVLDERGNQLEFATFGIDDSPMNVKEGYSKTIRRYDAQGAVVEVAYFGIRGEPVLNDEGFARVTYVKNSQGRNIETAYFGPDGKPLNQKHGYAKLTDRYDDYGASVEEDYFGANGYPVLNDNGIARIAEINDELGRAAEWAYFGIRGEPVIGSKDHRYHRAKQILDERGNQLQFATFGIDGKPLEVADSTSGRRCARLVRRFEANNKETYSECFDANGKRKLQRRQ
jgi:eukaryotic-like serine/threonine-protein kinase